MTSYNGDTNHCLRVAEDLIAYTNAIRLLVNSLRVLPIIVLLAHALLSLLLVVVVVVVVVVAVVVVVV